MHRRQQYCTQEPQARSSALLRQTLGVLIAVALSVSMISGPALAAKSDDAFEGAETIGALSRGTPKEMNGAANDLQVISASAEAYEKEKQETAARLADAASLQDSIPIETDGALESAVAENGSTVEIAPDGTALLSSNLGDEIGIRATGRFNSGAISVGSSVQTGEVNEADIVTRATENGAQLVAIFNDEAAEGRMSFEFELPLDSRMVEIADGSIAIEQDVEIERPLAGEEKRISDAVDAALIDLKDDQQLSESQAAELEQIAPAKMEVASETQQLAKVGVPWAIDAKGKALPTRYELSGETLTQVVDLRGAVFPVTADPALWWVIGTSAVCAAQLGTLAFGAAKVVAAFAKAERIIKSAKTVLQAYRALGNSMKSVLRYMERFVRNRSSLSTYQIRTIGKLVGGISSVIVGSLGLGGCYNLFRARW